MSCRRADGWSLVELLGVIIVLTTLMGVILPSLSYARDRARQVACSAMLRGVHVAMMSYAAVHAMRFPPFAFSDYSGDVPLSGHWGGASQVGGPDEFGRLGVSYVNLGALVQEGMLSQAGLVCPSAEAPLRAGRASYFVGSSRFSTFCLRVPPSEDLFVSAPNLAYSGGGSVLSIYAFAAGGQLDPTGRFNERVPQVRSGRRYRIVAPAACGDGDYDVAADAMLSDAFWHQQHATEPAGDDWRKYPVRSSWCHGGRFNVLYGDGAVRTVRDDGTVAANSIVPGGSLADDGENFATYAERVWQFFDAAPR